MVQLVKYNNSIRILRQKGGVSKHLNSDTSLGTFYLFFCYSRLKEPFDIFAMIFRFHKTINFIVALVLLSMVLVIDTLFWGTVSGLSSLSNVATRNVRNMMKQKFGWMFSTARERAALQASSERLLAFQRTREKMKQKEAYSEDRDGAFFEFSDDYKEETHSWLTDLHHFQRQKRRTSRSKIRFRVYIVEFSKEDIQQINHQPQNDNSVINQANRESKNNDDKMNVNEDEDEEYVVVEKKSSREDRTVKAQVIVTEDHTIGDIIAMISRENEDSHLQIELYLHDGRTLLHEETCLADIPLTASSKNNFLFVKWLHEKSTWIFPTFLKPYVLRRYLMHADENYGVITSVTQQLHEINVEANTVTLPKVDQLHNETKKEDDPPSLEYCECSYVNGEFCEGECPAFHKKQLDKKYQQTVANTTNRIINAMCMTLMFAHFPLVYSALQMVNFCIIYYLCFFTQYH